VIAGNVLSEVQSLAIDFPDSIEACALDVREAARGERTLARGLGRFGRLDALVDNAGVLRLGSPLARHVAIERARRAAARW
jgi:NADP-dependent 3-hydroxy acid dehydrogenase YdfG